MEVGPIAGDTRPSMWEVYENYRRSLLSGQETQQGQPAVDGLGGDSPIQAAADAGGCETCKSRKYQDGSNDAGVSFKTPTRVAPQQAASAVRGHEMEHVSRNRDEARREGRKVVSQSVTYHTAICPECGDSYVSGGTTRTTTKAVEEIQPAEQRQGQRGGIDLYA